MAGGPEGRESGAGVIGVSEVAGLILFGYVVGLCIECRRQLKKLDELIARNDEIGRRIDATLYMTPRDALRELAAIGGAGEMIEEELEHISLRRTFTLGLFS